MHRHDGSGSWGDRGLDGSGSMVMVSRWQSTKMGVAPVWMMAFAVAQKVIGVVMTSSPGPTPDATIARCRAAVHEEVASA
jgi:Mrp family chromosome partitioning ATPase